MKILALALILATGTMSAPHIFAGDGPPRWRVIIANDTCPDVTWGFTEAQTRQAFADLIAAHLDEMTRTDVLPLEDRDHYNATAYIEVEAFLGIYPQRRDELFRRIRQGCLCVSPFLCNSLWGFQSVEGALRTFYPARRMEREHGMPIDVAEHIELPSLPWGMATLLAGCGIRWTSVPFLDYDSTFKGLNNPPLFRLEGPDGSEVRVRLDAWASLKTSYYQGGYLLKDPKRVASEWIPHYAGLGAAYPLRLIFASGTHSDINPNSYKQARGFADNIIDYNANGTNAAKLINGTLAQFCAEVDAVEAASPFLPKLRGCFGQSWQLWPVSLARTAAALRENERAYMVAESLVALASQVKPDLVAQTREDREKAEWYWAMLSDHAWNGADPKNRRHNAELRQKWAEGLGGLSQRLTGQAWNELGLKADSRHITVFNPLSFARDILVECALPAEVTGTKGISSQVHSEGAERSLVFVAAEVPALGFREYAFETKTLRATSAPPFSGTATTLEGPFYRLRLDQGALAFEPLGNDQNWKEVTQNQNGESHFRFRYSLRAHAPGYDNATALAWSRNTAAPLTSASGRLPKKWLDRPHLEVDPRRALVTCMKPADDGASDQTVVRLWETGGRTGAVMVAAPGYRAAWETDLLEREREALAVKQGKVSLNARGYGFSAVKLTR